MERHGYGFCDSGMTGKSRALNILLLPIHAVQLLTSAKSFLDNPLIGSARLNRLGLHQARVRLADAMCRWRRRRLAPKLRSDWKEAFDRDGFVIITDFVPPEEFPALRRAILNYQGPTREMRQGDAVTRRMAIDPAMLDAIPALRAVMARADLKALFNYAASFRTTPIHYIQTIVSHCGGNEPDPQEEVHADSFHASMKAWLFLNPVSEEQGPFSYVRGSHRFNAARLAWEHQRSLRDPVAIDRLSARGSPRVRDEELATMGFKPAEPLALPANTLVVADTGGFHARGAAAIPGERVEIWSYARRNPFLPWTGGDLLSLPGIAERRVGWLWKIQDLIGRPWTPVGTRRALSAPEEIPE